MRKPRQELSFLCLGAKLDHGHFQGGLPKTKKPNFPKPGLGRFLNRSRTLLHDSGTHVEGSRSINWEYSLGILKPAQGPYPRAQPQEK